jgi:hypothetical protein
MINTWNRLQMGLHITENAKNKNLQYSIQEIKDTIWSVIVKNIKDKENGIYKVFEGENGFVILKKNTAYTLISTFGDVGSYLENNGLKNLLVKKDN